MAKAKITTFKGVAMCRLVNKHRHFAGKYSLFFRVGFFAVRKDIYICSVTFKRTEIFCRICGLECSAVSCGVMRKGAGVAGEDRNRNVRRFGLQRYNHEVLKLSFQAAWFPASQRIHTR